MAPEAGMSRRAGGTAEHRGEPGQVFGARDHRDDPRSQHDPLVQEQGPQLVREAHQRQQDGQELDGRFELAPDRWLNDGAGGGGHTPQAKDDELAPDDDEGDPRIGSMHVDQGDERARHQQLVRGGVQEGAQRGGRAPSPGQIAIQEVCGGCHEEDGGSCDEGPSVPSTGQRQRNDHRHQDDPEIRDGKEQADGWPSHARFTCFAQPWSAICGQLRGVQTIVSVGSGGSGVRSAGRGEGGEGAESGDAISAFVTGRTTMSQEAPDRNLALEVVRVTEAAALGAARWIGKGQKESADQAAVDAMRLMLDTVSMDGVVVIGEGEKDHAPMLYNGEAIGNGEPPHVDVAVDPLEGTRLTALGQPNAIAVVALSERGTMFFPGAALYMDKIACGPEAADAIDIDASPTENVTLVAEAKGVSPREISIVVLERDRHEDLIAELRAAGAKVLLIRDGDVAPAIAAAQSGTGVDLLMGIGGTPEGVIAAAAIKCSGAALEGKLWPRNDEERQALVGSGYDIDRVLTADDLVAGEDVFVAATGVTTGALLRGVQYTRGGAATDSIVMRSRSGTVRRIEARHALEKLSQISGLEYR